MIVPWALDRRSAGRTAACIALLTGALLGSQRGASPTPVAAQRSAHLVYVAMGGSHTVGAGADNPTATCYPAVLARRFPRGTRYINVARTNTGIQAALTDELPPALAAHPTVVTVWLGLSEMIHGVSAANYEKDLDRLLSALRRTHAHVFVANVPNPLDIPNGFFNKSQNVGIANAYNAAIAASGRRYGAVVVDLHAVSRRLWGNHDFVADTGFLDPLNGIYLNARGYAALADVFYRTIMATRGIARSIGLQSISV